MNSHPITGSCLCGKVNLAVSSFDREVVACHCTQCRKQTGHFVAATRVANEALSMSGEENLTWFQASNDAERGFCSTCGSILLWRANGSDHTSIMAGCLDAPTGLTLERHIFVDDKGDYYDIEPGALMFGQAD